MNEAGGLGSERHRGTGKQVAAGPNRVGPFPSAMVLLLGAPCGPHDKERPVRQTPVSLVELQVLLVAQLPPGSQLCCSPRTRGVGQSPQPTWATLMGNLCTYNASSSVVFDSESASCPLIPRDRG